MAATSAETVHQILSELGDVDGEDCAEFMKRASELYYSNEDKIVGPQHFAARHNGAVESDADDADLVQHMKEAAEYYFNDEGGLAFLPAHFLDDEESNMHIQSDSDASGLSMETLKKAEAIVMSEIEPEVEILDVAIAKEVVIHTVLFKAGPQGYQSHKVPLVMVHGFGGGNPAFHKNYGQLAKDRCVYGIDLPGFALSSRVNFSNDATICENEIVDMIESWRKAMNLKEIILLGHSFGGYISAAYAFKHSSHVHHLFLLDPWGVLSQKEDENQQSKKMFEWILIKFCEAFKANPFKAVQRLGPTKGGHIIRKLMGKDDREDYGENCVNYFVQAITTGKPSGAKAFAVLSDYTFVYPKAPLKERIRNLLSSIHLPITFIYGEKSEFKNKAGQDIKTASQGRSVQIKYVKEGTHHIHVQKPEEVVKIILNSISDHIQED